MKYEYTTNMHGEYRSKLKPVSFAAIGTGFINVNPTLGSLGLVAWTPGDTIVLTKTEFGSEWGLHIRRAGRSQWEVAPIPFGGEEQVLDRLLAKTSLEVSGSFPVQLLVALNFVAPVAGSVSTSAEGGLGWDEGERIIFRKLPQGDAWRLIIGHNYYVISGDVAADVHCKLVELHDSTLDKLISIIEHDENFRALNAQVTSLQERCTALLEEKRRAYIDYAVREFHLKFGHPAPTELAVPPEEVVRFRGRLITEEYLELLNALFKSPNKRPWVLAEIKDKLGWIVDNADVVVDMVQFVDGTHDLDYVVAGTRVVFGYDGLPGALEVHRANMDKEPAGGDKKPTKPPGWKPPDIERVLREQGWKRPA